MEKQVISVRQFLPYHSNFLNRSNLGTPSDHTSRVLQNMFTGQRLHEGTNFRPK